MHINCLLLIKQQHVYDYITTIPWGNTMDYKIQKVTNQDKVIKSTTQLTNQLIIHLAKILHSSTSCIIKITLKIKIKVLHN